MTCICLWVASYILDYSAQTGHGTVSSLILRVFRRLASTDPLVVSIQANCRNVGKIVYFILGAVQCVSRLQTQIHRKLASSLPKTSQMKCDTFCSYGVRIFEYHLQDLIFFFFHQCSISLFSPF